jgi:Flp pilus assembly secretin CpaC
MDRRLFTAGLAAGAAAGLAGPALPVPYLFLNTLEDENTQDLLQVPNLRHLRTLFRDAPPVLSPSDLAGTGQPGLKLILAPDLNTRDGSVRLNVRAEIKDISRPLLTMDATAAGAPRMDDTGLEFSGNVYATGDPGLLVRKVQTGVTVQNGETIVIAGLMHNTPDHATERNAALPFFGDLPVIGRAFRSSVDTDRHRELIIFVTARLAQPD